MHVILAGTQLLNAVQSLSWLEKFWNLETESQAVGLQVSINFLNKWIAQQNLYGHVLLKIIKTDLFCVCFVR